MYLSTKHIFPYHRTNDTLKWICKENIVEKVKLNKNRANMFKHRQEFIFLIWRKKNAFYPKKYILIPDYVESKESSLK